MARTGILLIVATFEESCPVKAMAFHLVVGIMSGAGNDWNVAQE